MLRHAVVPAAASGRKEWYQGLPMGRTRSLAFHRAGSSIDQRSTSSPPAAPWHRTATHLRQSLVLTANRPLGVSIRMLGGLYGYCAGNMTLPASNDGSSTWMVGRHGVGSGRKARQRAATGSAQIPVSAGRDAAGRRACSAGQHCAACTAASRGLGNGPQH